MLGVHVRGADIVGGALDVTGYREAAERVSRDFGPSVVAVTLRESLSASDNGWSAVLWDTANATLLQSQRYLVRLVINGRGAGQGAGWLIGPLVAAVVAVAAALIVAGRLGLQGGDRA